MHDDVLRDVMEGNGINKEQEKCDKDVYKILQWNVSGYLKRHRWKGLLNWIGDVARPLMFLVAVAAIAVCVVCVVCFLVWEGIIFITVAKMTVFVAFISFAVIACGYLFFRKMDDIKKQYLILHAGKMYLVVTEYEMEACEAFFKARMLLEKAEEISGAAYHDLHIMIMHIDNLDERLIVKKNNRHIKIAGAASDGTGFVADIRYDIPFLEYMHKDKVIQERADKDGEISFTNNDITKKGFIVYRNITNQECRYAESDMCIIKRYCETLEVVKEGQLLFEYIVF